MTELTHEDIVEALLLSKDDKPQASQDRTIVVAASMLASLLIDIRERLDKIIDQQMPPNVKISGKGFSITQAFQKGTKAK